jgi:hypothetical protein
MISRRNFLKLSAIAGVGLVLPYQLLSNAPRVLAFSQSDQLKKYGPGQKLGMVGSSDIPLATADHPSTIPTWWQPGVDHYTIDIGAYTDQLHPDLPNETRLWGYSQNFKEPALDANNNLIPGPEFLQFGTEGGFLPYPVVVNGPLSPQPQIQLLMAPAERADLIVDFRGKAGMTYILYNDAAAPFPMGDSLNDYNPGNPDTPSAKPGVGPNTRTLLQIRVIGSDPGPLITLPSVLTPTDPFLVTQHPGYPTPVPDGVNVRRLTLNETYDDNGRLIQNLGTDVALDFAKYGFGRPFCG